MYQLPGLTCTFGLLIRSAVALRLVRNKMISKLSHLEKDSSFDTNVNLNLPSMISYNNKESSLSWYDYPNLELYYKSKKNMNNLPIGELFSY